jgi:PAS domain S-box-containing protein
VLKRSGSAAMGARLQRQALTIVVGYSGLAAVWIASSDRLLGAVVPDTEGLVRFSVFKGLAFVAATAGFLYILLRRTVATITRAFGAAERERAERLSYEEQRDRANAIIDSTDDAIIGTTLDGVITTWNRSARTMFGYTEDEIIGSTIDRFIPAERKAEASLISKRIRAGERPKQLETLRVRKDGTTFPAAITFSPIWASQDGTPGNETLTGASQIVRDVTERKLIEAVAESERRFARSLIEAMPNIFYLYDQSGRFLRWNNNFERVSGYTAEELTRMHPLDFFAADEKALLEQRIAEVFEVGASSVEASFVAKDGQRTPYLFTGQRIVFDGAACLIGVGIDIAERQRAEQGLRRSEERYRSTLDCILEGCQLLDFDWRYLYLNEAAAKQNRRPNAELIGHRMPEAWPGIEATPVFGMLRRCLLERVALHEETEFRFPDGHVGWFDVRVQPVPEGIFVLSIDISERKQAEQALRELNEALERKIAERTRDLDAAKERAEAADRIKSAFLATMSHELRTPLNSIIGFTGIVLQGLAGALSAEQSKQLGMVQGSARHLLDLINDVLDISKIEAGQLAVRRAKFDLRASIERVAASVAPLADKKGLFVRVDLATTLGEIESDQRRVEQILLNLLNNAIKFTDRGGVTLCAGLAEGRSSSTTVSRCPAVIVQVTDTGIGMKEAELSQLFQPFRQIDSGLQRQHEGTGLGLAICRRLTELLGGSIRVQSTWGQGSLFTVVLPTGVEAFDESNYSSD